MLTSDSEHEKEGFRLVHMMNVILKLALVILCGISSAVLADDKADLQQAFFKMKMFSADFSQTVATNEGKTLQQVKGTLQMLRPNYFKMITTSPDNTQLITDGVVVYSYDEMLDQVTLYDFSTQVSNSPLMLLITEDKKVWDNYTVRHEANNYLVTPKAKQGNVASMQVTLVQDRVATLKVTEKDGKTNQYNFTPKEANLTATDFKFSIADGVEVDDQRAN